MSRIYPRRKGRLFKCPHQKVAPPATSAGGGPDTMAQPADAIARCLDTPRGRRWG